MKICYGFCGSFCTVGRSLQVLEKLKEQGHTLIPVGSYHFINTDTRFGEARQIKERIEKICQTKLIDSINGAEPIGPVLKPDLMIIAPLTGNSLCKLANGISDTPVTLAAKSHLRSGRPLLLALATNDGLSGNFENLAKLYQKKNIYFLPLTQDDPKNKPNSLVSNFEKIPLAIEYAMQGKQLLPLFEVDAAGAGD